MSELYCLFFLFFYFNLAATIKETSVPIAELGFWSHSCALIVLSDCLFFFFFSLKAMILNVILTAIILSATVSPMEI